MKTIDRHNLLELLGNRSYVYHSAILTCYTFDPIFFNAYLMPKFRQNGIGNIVILLDSDHYDQVMESLPLYNLDLSNLSYTIVRQTPSSSGVFHPKISLFIGQEAGLLVVGSGNLTYNGYSLNEEIWGAFRLKGESTEFAPLFKKAWSYLNSVYSSDSLLVRQQLKWMIDNSSLLDDIVRNDYPDFAVSDGVSFHFISNDADGSILLKLKQILKKSTVKSLKIISPFYDINGQSVTNLIKEFEPKNTYCIFEKYGTYPYDIMKKGNGIKFYEWDDNFIESRGLQHHLHGKLFQFETNNGTFLMIGSANATSNAFGKGHNYINDEACIVLHSKSSKDFFSTLGVTFEHPFALKSSGTTLERPHAEMSERSDFEYQIIYSEIIDDRISIKLNVSNGKVRVGFIGLEDGVFRTVAATIKNNFIKLKMPDDISITMVVIVDNDSNEISNRSFITDEDQVSRCNPNQKLQKLTSLLEAAGDWRVELVEILSYVVFDEENLKSTTTRAKEITKSKSKEQGNKVIQKEQFEDLIDKDKAHVLSLPNIRIADFLLTTTNETKSEDVSDGIDDISTDTDLDDGNNSYGKNKETNDPLFAKTQLVNFSHRYNKRLSSYYDLQLADFYTFLKKKQNRLPKYEDIDMKPAKLVEFSNMLISLILQTKSLETGLGLVSEKAQRTIFVKTISQFLLMYAHGYELQDNYASHKMVEYHKAIAVQALTLIASFFWYGKDKTDALLIVLNLLESFRKAQNVKTSDLYKLYAKQTKRTNLAYDERSQELIKGAFAIFDLYEKARVEKTNIKQIDRFFSSCIIYKSPCGFVFASDFKKNKSGKGAWLYEYDIQHPAFQEPFHIQAGKMVAWVSEEI